MEKTSKLTKPIKAQSLQRGGFLLGLAVTAAITAIGARNIWIEVRTEIGRAEMQRILSKQEFRVGSRGERVAVDELTVQQLRAALALETAENRSLRETLQTIAEIAK